MVTGNGWYLTKHSAAVLASSPPESLPKDGLLDELPSTGMQSEAAVVKPDAEGPASVETYTVAYDRGGKPTRGVVLGRTESGDRFLANTPDSEAFLEEFVGNEQVGTKGTLQIKDGLARFDI